MKKIESRNLNINTCEGCTNCFRLLKCHLDQQDNFNKIKEELEIADFIIMSSPVFMHNVNVSMKNFIDRLAYWSHLFHLRGKHGMVIASASNNGTDIVINYLEKILKYLGVSTICSAKLTQANNHFDSETSNFVDRIVKILDDPRYFDPTIDYYFTSMKMVMKLQDQAMKEYQYWQENKLFNYQSLKEYL